VHVVEHDANDHTLERITEAMVALETDAVPKLVKDALEAGYPAQSIVGALTVGINTVGDKFESMEYFLPELITAAGTMDESMDILRPAFALDDAAAENKGTIVLAQVQGDIHDIGRSILAAMLRAARFTIHDLGHDVAPDLVIDKALEYDADVIGLSALLTTSLPYAARLPRLLVDRGLEGRFQVALGGGAVTPDYVARIGADGYAEDAAAAVRLMHRLVAER
jgi:methylmalonyl-CoA mutase cobalamin-binding domain/chain